MIYGYFMLLPFKKKGFSLIFHEITIQTTIKSRIFTWCLDHVFYGEPKMARNREGGLRRITRYINK